MKVGSLFSGAGLGDFGWEMAGYDLRWQVEINEYCRKILDLRWPEVKKYDDIKTVKDLEPVDLITGGFPCQPFSVAGKQNGRNDDRNLWPQMLRVVKDVKPRWVVCENVPGIIPLYLDTVLADLGNAGYTSWPVVFSSHSLGAWHKRERLWIICHSQHDGQPTAEKSGSVDQRNDGSPAGTKQTGESSGSSQQYAPLADTIGNTARSAQRARGNGERASIESQYRDGMGNDVRDSGKTFRRFWKSEPGICRVAHGITSRVDRLKSLGNGQTPCSTYVIGEWIKQYEKLGGF